MSETDAAPNAARSDEIDRLRVVAFGRTTTDADELAAGEALAELARIDAEIDAEREAEREAERRAALAAAEPPVAEPVEAPADDAPLDAEQPPRWRSWATPAAVGLVVGAVIAAGIGYALTPAPVDDHALTTTSDSVTDNGASTSVNYFLGDAPGATSTDGTMAGLTSTGGDVQAAERWFADAQTDEDLVGVGSLLPEFDRSSVRLVHASSIARAWVAKRVDGQLCLEVTVSETDYTSGSCALPTDFSDRGLTVSSDTITVRWNGGQLNVLLASPPTPTP